MTNILIDITHPGQFYVFNRLISILGDEVSIYIFAINKDNLIQYIKKRKSMTLFLFEDQLEKKIKILDTPKNILRCMKIIQKYEIDLVLGIHPAYGGIAGKILNIPVISFADTEHAKEQMALYWPASKMIFTPQSFYNRISSNQITYNGLHELSYLHPDVFKPDHKIVREMGFDHEEFIVYRIINWNAIHDLGHGNDISNLKKQMEYLSRDYKIILSVEGETPFSLKKFETAFDRINYHNILAAAKLYIGPGATSASEAACLGTPSIYTNEIKLGYIDDLTYNWGLVKQISQKKINIPIIGNILDEQNSYYTKKSLKMVNEMVRIDQLMENIINFEEYLNIENLDVEIIKKFNLKNPLYI